jgi:hypothetical protein
MTDALIKRGNLDTGTRRGETTDKSSHHKLRKEMAGEATLPTHWSQTPSFKNHEKINVYCSNHPMCDTLLWQP